MRYVLAIFVMALVLLDIGVNKSRVVGPFAREITRVGHEVAARF